MLTKYQVNQTRLSCHENNGKTPKVLRQIDEFSYQIITLNKLTILKIQHYYITALRKMYYT